MEENKPIPYIEGLELEEGKKYISECGIEFTYNIDNIEKPYILNNGIRLNHIPIKKDTGTNNLVTMMMKTPEEIKKMAAQGGKAAQAVYKKRRSFKESFELFLSLGISEEQLQKIDPFIISKIPEAQRKELTQADLITLKQMELSQDGSEKHSVFVRDTVGEKPVDRQEIQADIITDADRQLIDKISKRLEDNKQ